MPARRQLIVPTRHFMQLTYITTSELLADRADDLVAYTFEDIQLFIREWMVPHERIHGRKDVD